MAVRIARVSLLLLAAAAGLGRLSVALEGRGRARRALGVAMLLAYACVCARLTLVGRRVGAGPQANLQPLWSYRAALMWQGHRLRVQDAGLLEQIVLNYLLFVPLGCLLPFTWPGRYAGDGAARGVARVALVAAACSLCVELAQLVLRVGLFELDDVLNNALGAVMGYVLYRLAERTAKLVPGMRGSARHQPRHPRR